MITNVNWPKTKNVTFEELSLGEVFVLGDHGVYVKTNSQNAVSLRTRTWIDFNLDTKVYRIEQIDVVPRTN